MATPPVVDLAARLRRSVADSLDRLSSALRSLRLPPPAGEAALQGEGHFHLAPELFLQLSGWTRFRFPHTELVLEAGEVLLLPPKLLHAESVGAGKRGEAFCNVVIYAEGGALSCHLANETAPGTPAILYLETRLHPQAQRVQAWLTDAARLGRSPEGGAEGRRWADAQVRALVSAATAGVLRALDDAEARARADPPLVARVRVLVQNQLGDHRLSVRQLAAQSGCTPDYLSHVFAQATGEHLVAFVNRQRMARAAHLMRETALSGKEVAWACGFAGQSYFIRTFREHFGVTPKAWRAGQREDV